ncbi:MAG: response regulator transcription factor [Acidipila sp.]|nr:response regulator transcription factor [Acidipila sp.]
MAIKREKIVLVETDPDTRQALEAELEAAGYETFSTESCSEGFEAAGKGQADVVVLDAGAPGSCWSAAVVALKGAAATAAIRVVVLSSLGPGERARALEKVAAESRMSAGSPESVTSIPRVVGELEVFARKGTNQPSRDVGLLPS